MILFLTLVVTLIVVKDSVAVETPVLVEFCSNGGNKSEQRWFGCKESCPDDWQTLKQDPKGNSGAACFSGSKSLCLCNCTVEWKGTSPFCKGECPSGATVVRKDKKGDGFSCLSGEKVLCRTCSYAKLPPTSATTPTRSTGILRPDPSGLGDDKTRSTVRSFDRFSTSTTRKYFGWETGTTRRSFTDYPDRDTTWKRATNRFETDRTTNWGSESKRPTGRFEPTASPGTAGGVDDCHSVWIGLTPDCNGWCPDGWNIVGKSNTGPGWTCKTGQKFRCQKCDKDSGAAVVSQENRNGHIKASG